MNLKKYFQQQQISRNTKQIVYISCFCHFFIGSLVTTIGIFIPEVGNYYIITPVTLGYVYSFFQIGLLIAIGCSGLIISNIDIKKTLTFCCFISFFSVLALNLYPNLNIYRAVLLILGLTSGIFVSSGNFLVVSSIENINLRTSKLIMADLFFSLSGIILPWLFAMLLEKRVTWFLLYNLIIIPCIAIFFMIKK